MTLKPSGCITAVLLLVCGHLAMAEADRDEAHSSSLYAAGAFTRLSAAAFADTPAPATASVQEDQIYLGEYRFRAGNSAAGISFDYQYTRYEFDGIRGRNRDLHRVQVPLRIVSTGNDWTVESVIAPGISTSSNVLGDFFRKGSSDDLSISGRIEARRTGGRGGWVAGAAYNRAFGRPLMYPVGGYELRPRDGVLLRLVLPDPGFRIRLSRRHSLNARMFPAGHQWHVVSDELDDDFDYRVEALRSQLGWNIETRSALSIDISVGYEFARHHRFTDDQGLRIRSSLDDEWLFAVGFRFGTTAQPLTHGYHQ